MRHQTTIVYYIFIPPYLCDTDNSGLNVPSVAMLKWFHENGIDWSLYHRHILGCQITLHGDASWAMVKLAYGHKVVLHGKIKRSTIANSPGVQ